MKVRKPEDEPFEIMLIPMIDIMLVIIIFFLVATTMKNRQSELPLQLPESAASVSVEQEPELLIIGVDSQGRTYMNTDGILRPVDNTFLHQRIREVAAATPNRRVRIDGDRDTRYESIVRIVDLCQFEGLKNVGLHTKADGR
ncbi:MAG: biopolymer transporter ExbD [Verrucomicrobia bacterium]|nr:biopolymer transporter ExbD [Verrucomicrobiota bacterium]